MKELENYPGNKGNSGVWQTIINHMPPHRIYIEGSLGSGKIIRKKKPAKLNIGIEKSEKVFSVWKKHQKEFPHLMIIHGDMLEYLDEAYLSSLSVLQHGFFGMGAVFQPSDVCVYLDPPYPRDSRGSKDDIYEHEWTDEDHERMLEKIVAARFYVLISTYPNTLYEKHLTKKRGWNYTDFKTRTRTRTVTERLYFNFPVPHELHDYRFVGKNYRDRERIKNKISRRVKSLLSLKKRNPVEFHAVMDAINNRTHG